jgi:ABC-type multidrug transport system permease subunit
MHFALSCAIKDFKRHLRDPLEIATWLGIPLLIGFMVTMAMGGKGGPQPQAHILVADEDGSFLSGLFVGALSQEAAGGVIRAENVATEDGMRRIQRGEATALLRIPEAFGECLLLEKPSVLELHINPSQQILPNIVEEYLLVLLDGVFYLHRVIGEDLQTFAGGPPDGSGTFPDLTVSNFSVKINHLAGRLGRYLDPPLIRFESKESEKENSGDEVSAGLLFFPGILFMSLLFVALAMSSDLWQEKKQKTLLRVVVSPQRTSAFLFGKLAAGSVFIFSVALVALSIGYAYFSLYPATLPFAVLWSTMSGVMLLSLLLLLQLFASSQRAGSILNMALIFPLMMLGGSFFPFEAMPSWMAAVGKFTPNGWALEHLKDILLRRTDIAGSVTAFLGVLAVSIVLFLFAVRRLRSSFVVG